MCSGPRIEEVLDLLQGQCVREALGAGDREGFLAGYLLESDMNSNGKLGVGS